MRHVLELLALASMLAFILCAGIFIEIAVRPDNRIEALRNTATHQDCVVAFKAYSARFKGR